MNKTVYFKSAKKWVPLCLLILFILGAYALGLHNIISLQALQEQKQVLYSYVQSQPYLSGLVFILIYIAAVALSLPAATLLTLLGGFLFGKWLGTLFVVSAATIGATILFIIARSSIGQTLRDKAGTVYKKVEENMKENAAGYLLFMRLVPIFPFFIVNIVPALFNINLRTYILTTFIGIIPGSFVYVNAGQALGELESLNDLVSQNMIFAFVLLGLFALIPTFYMQFKRRRNG